MSTTSGDVLTRRWVLLPVPDLPALDTGWHREAACRGLDLGWFYPESSGRGATSFYLRGRAACADCPVQLECLLEGLASEETTDPFGLRAGMTPDQRREPLQSAARLAELAAARTMAGRMTQTLYRLVTGRLQVLRAAEAERVKRRKKRRARESDGRRLAAAGT